MPIMSLQKECNVESSCKEGLPTGNSGRLRRLTLEALFPDSARTGIKCLHTLLQPMKQATTRFHLHSETHVITLSQYQTLLINSRATYKRAKEMAHWVRALTPQRWGPEFWPRHSFKIQVWLHWCLYKSTVRGGDERTQTPTCWPPAY